MTFNFNIKGITPQDIQTSGGSSGGSSGGGGSTDLTAKGIIDGSITNLNNKDAEEVRTNAFYQWKTLETVSLPNVTTVGEKAFYGCSYLTSVNIPNATTIALSAFYSCIRLASINLSNVKYLNTGAFTGCKALTSVDLSSAVSVLPRPFENCVGLTKVWLPSTITSIDCSGASSAPFYGCSSSLVIYTDIANADAKPAGWGSYWNYYSSSNKCSVVYGATYEDFKNA